MVLLVTKVRLRDLTPAEPTQSIRTATGLLSSITVTYQSVTVTYTFTRNSDQQVTSLSKEIVNR